MPRFFCQDISDQSGMVLAGAKEAREEAIKTASELLPGDGQEFWDGPDWEDAGDQRDSATGVHDRNLDG
jgi:hypothetical protein